MGDSNGALVVQPERLQHDLIHAFRHLRMFAPVVGKLSPGVGRRSLSLDQITDVVGSDPALATHILTVANSALFSPATPFSNVGRAIAYLGVDHIHTLVMSAAFRACSTGPGDTPALAAIWEHCLGAALIARQLAAGYAIEPAQAYAASLLHDLGRLGLLAALPEQYAGFLAATHGSPVAAREVERRLFGMDHCEAGSMAAHVWPSWPDLYNLTARHHDPATDGGSPLFLLTCTSCLLANVLGISAIRVQVAGHGKRRRWQRVNLCLPLRFHVVQGPGAGREGGGRSVDISREGLLFEAEYPPPAGATIEVALDWVLHGNRSLARLLTTGRVLRSHGTKAAARTDGWHFSRQLSNQLRGPAFVTRLEIPRSTPVPVD